MIIDTTGFSDQDAYALAKKMRDLLKIESSLMDGYRLRVCAKGGDAMVFVHSPRPFPDDKVSLEGLSGSSFLRLRGPSIHLTYDSGDEFDLTRCDGSWSSVSDDFALIRLEDSLEEVKLGTVYTLRREAFSCVDFTDNAGMRNVSVSLPGDSLTSVAASILKAMSRELAFTLYLSDGDGSALTKFRHEAGTFLKY